MFLYEFNLAHLAQHQPGATGEPGGASAGVFGSVQCISARHPEHSLLEPRCATPPRLQAVAGSLSGHGIANGVQRHLFGLPNQPIGLPTPAKSLQR